jgi:hypothetical protein
VNAKVFELTNGRDIMGHSLEESMNYFLNDKIIVHHMSQSESIEGKGRRRVYRKTLTLLYEVQKGDT